MGWRTREVLNRILENKSYSPLPEIGGTAVPIPDIEALGEKVIQTLDTIGDALLFIPTPVSEGASAGFKGVAASFKALSRAGKLTKADVTVVARLLIKVRPSEWIKLSKVVGSTDDLVRLAKIVDEGGDEAVGYVQDLVGGLNAGLKLNPNVPKQIDYAWGGHAEELKKALGITTKEQLPGKLQSLIDNSQVRRGILQHSKDGIGPWRSQYWLFDKKTGTYVVFDKAGNLIDAYPPTRGFDYVMTGENFRWQLEIK